MDRVKGTIAVAHTSSILIVDTIKLWVETKEMNPADRWLMVDTCYQPWGGGYHAAC